MLYERALGQKPFQNKILEFAGIRVNALTGILRTVFPRQIKPPHKAKTFLTGAAFSSKHGLAFVRENGSRIL